MPPPPEKVLFFAAGPADQQSLKLGRELDAINDVRRESALRDRWEVEPRMETAPADFQVQLREHRPLVVHFSGHGTGREGLVTVRGADGQTHLVPTDALSSLFTGNTYQVGCVLLNACFSRVQAEGIVRHVPFVIGMKEAIGDPAAIHFSRGFYGALFDGQPVREAFRQGVTEIQLNVSGAATAPDRIANTGGSPHARPLAEHEKPVLFESGRPLPRPLPAPAPPVVPPSPPAVSHAPNRDAVVAFNIHFQQRKRLLAYLNMYKTLHDVLHEVRDKHGWVLQAVERQEHPSAPPPPVNMKNELTAWLKRGQLALAMAPESAHRPAWFEAFEAAAVYLTGGLGGKVDSGAVQKATTTLEELDGSPPTLTMAAELLGKLPADVQGELNRNLIRTAEDLNAAELLALLDRLLARLRDDAALQAEADVFRKRCHALKVLVENHGHCQKVDGAVSGIGRDPGHGQRQRRMTRKQWYQVCQELGKLTVTPPLAENGDIATPAAFLYRDAALDSARECEAAATDPSKELPFDPFQEAFHKLFLDTDKDLIRVIEGVIATGKLLDAHLTRYLQ